MAAGALALRIGSSVPLADIAPTGRGIRNADTFAEMHHFIAVVACEE
jgi:hypothetical protein